MYSTYGKKVIHKIIKHMKKKEIKVFLPSLYKINRPLCISLKGLSILTKHTIMK